MDHHYFLCSRTAFIERFYAEASGPFTERQRKIEAREAPFDLVEYSEDPEPAFLEAWVDAADALDVLGQSAISMVSTSLHLYLKAWASEFVSRVGKVELAANDIGLPTDRTYKPAFKNGWLNGYRTYCGRAGVDWNAAPFSLSVLEDLVLARNTVQHTDDITSIRARQSDYRASKRPSSFFADPLSLSMRGNDRSTSWLWPVRLDLNQEKVITALKEVTGFCGWLNGQLPSL